MGGGGSVPVFACAAGYYCGTGNISNPAPLQRIIGGAAYPCPDGFFCPADTSDFREFPCPVGSVCAGRAAAPVLCPLGSYCSPSVRYLCPAGAFSAALGATSPATCRPACGPGSFSPYLGAASPNATCLECPAGVYGVGAGLASAACSGPCSAPPGYGCPAGSTSASVALCGSGQHCPGGSPAPATPCMVPAQCAAEGLSAELPCLWNVSTLAGSGASAPFADGAGERATFYNPAGVAASPDGAVFVADNENHRVRRVVVSTGAVTTLAGSGAPGWADGIGTAARFFNPYGLALHPVTGELFCADYGNSRIRRISPAGVTATFAGSGTSAWADGAGTSASFSQPSGLAVDGAGVVYVADTGNHRVRIITALGIVSTLAGTGSSTPFADGPGTSTATFFQPASVALDGRGSVFVSDTRNNRIRMIAPNGTVSTFAGNGSDFSADGAGTLASFSAPTHLAFAANGNLLVADQGSSSLRMSTPLGVVTTLAGGARGGFQEGFGTASLFSAPYGVTVSGSGAIFISDNLNFRVRQLTCAPCPPSFACDTGVPLLCPPGAYCIPNDNVFLPPTLCPAGKFSAASGATSGATCTPCLPGSYSAPGAAACTLCPAGVYGSSPGLESPECTGNCSVAPGFYCPAGSSAPTNATLCPAGAFCAGGGAANVSCYPVSACTVTGLSSQPQCYWNASTLAGSPTQGAGRADGLGTSASFGQPSALACNALGNVIVSDSLNNLVRTVTPLGLVTTLAGSPRLSGSSDGLGTLASFSTPRGIALDASGSAYIVQENAYAVRKVSPAGVVSTVSGSATARGSSDGSWAAATFGGLFGITLDSQGNIFATETSSHTVRALWANGTTATVAGWHNLSAGYSNGIGRASALSAPIGIVADRGGNVFIADSGNHGLRRIALPASSQEVTLFAGSPTQLSGGADGVGTAALFSSLFQLAIDSTGTIFAAEQASVIRRVSPSGAVTTLAGVRGSGGRANGFSSTFGAALGIAVAASGTVYVSEFNNSIRQLTCVPCPASYYCASGVPVLCPRGAYCPLSSINATLCPPGTYSSATGAASNATCQPCPCPAACIAPGLAYASCSSTLTPSPTPSPSTSPPPFACLSNPSGCLSPRWLPPAPAGAAGPAPLPPSFTPPTPVLASWPFLSTPLSILLPLSPSPGESATLFCTTTPTSAFSSLRLTASPNHKPCSPPSPSCLAIPSSPAASAVTDLTLTISVSAPANASLNTADVTCTLLSTPLATSSTAGLPYPHYGLVTVLPPLAATAVPFSLPLLAAALRESSTTPGAFTVLGGDITTAGAVRSLPALFDLAAACQAGGLGAFAANLTATSPSVWTQGPLIFACPPALRALHSLYSSLPTTPSSAALPIPFLAGTLSGSRHLLLVASPLTPFPADPGLLSVSLGGVPCAVNWVLPTLASITTPSVTALCSTNSSGVDCGLAPLVLSYSRSPPLLPLLAAYPPLLPTCDWGTQLAALALVPASSLIGLPLPQLLASAAAQTPQGVGLRIVARCSDPTYAPPEMCTVVGFAQPLRNGSSLLCVWGTGDACLPCPTGALCPGGAVLLPLPGYWTPSPASLPSEVYACLDPGATVRCPGYSAISSSGGVYGCGEGFRGQLCAACDASFFPLRGSCARCPAFSLAAFFMPLLVFAGGLAAFGATMVLLVYCTLKWRSGSGARISACHAAQPVQDLVVWTWIAAQGLASLFSQTQALAPPALGPVFTAISALQFQGIALDPSCYTSIPFASFFAALGAVVALYSFGVLALCSLRRSQTPPIAATFSKGITGRATAVSAFCNAPAIANSVLALCALALSLGYGALTAVFAGALVCTPVAPMTVADYLQTSNDGSTLLAQRPSLSPASLPALFAASRNPLLAASNGLSATLSSTLKVSVLASDPFSVCSEGMHRVVRPLAMLCVAFVTLALPLGQIWTLLRVGRLKCLQRHAPTGLKRLLAVSHPSVASGGGVPTSVLIERPPPAFLFALSSALTDPTLLRRSTWYSAAAQLQLALLTGLMAASQARLPLPLFLACQGAVAAVSAVACVLVARLQLYMPTHAWKWPVVALLNAVTGITAVLNAVLVAKVGGAASGAGAAPGSFTSAVVALPLACAALTLTTLLVSWWRSLRMPVMDHAPTAPLRSAGAGSESVRVLAQQQRQRFSLLSYNPLKGSVRAAAGALLVQWWRRQLLRRRDRVVLLHNPLLAAQRSVSAAQHTAWAHEVPSPVSARKTAALNDQHRTRVAVQQGVEAAAAAAATVAIATEATAQIVEQLAEPQPSSEAQRESRRLEQLQRLGAPGDKWGKERVGRLFSVLSEHRPPLAQSWAAAAAEEGSESQSAGTASAPGAGAGAGAALGSSSSSECKGSVSSRAAPSSAAGAPAATTPALSLVQTLVNQSLQHAEKQQQMQRRHFASGWKRR